MSRWVLISREVLLEYLRISRAIGTHSDGCQPCRDAFLHVGAMTDEAIRDHGQVAADDVFAAGKWLIDHGCPEGVELAVRRGELMKRHGIPAG